MIPVACLLALDALSPIRAAYANLEESAVRVSITAVAGDQHTSFSYDVYRDRLGRFRIDLRTAVASEYTVYSDGKTITTFDSLRNVHARSQYVTANSPLANVIAAFGGSEPMMQVFLEPKTGLDAFLSRWNAREFIQDGDTPSELVAVGSALPVRIFVSPRTNLIEAVIAGEAGTAAKWQISAAPLGLEQAIPWAPPENSRQMESLAPRALPTAIISREALPIVEKSKAAYQSLRFLSFSSTAYLFTDEAEDTRLANAWWQRGGKLRMAVTLISANRSFETLFDGESLSAFDRANAKAFRGPARRNRVLDLIDAMGGPVEPLVGALFARQDYWARFLQPGSVTSLLSNVGSELAQLQIKTLDGWTVDLNIRPDGLIDRIDRKLMVDGITLTSETVIYTFTRINEWIPERAWTLPIPDGTKFGPLPKLE